MDFFEHRYYKTNRDLMSLVGLWPYQTKRAGYGFRTLVFLLGASHTIPQILAVVGYRDDFEIILEASMSLIFILLDIVKLISSVCNSGKMLKLLNRIRTDWEVWAKHGEINILHKYTEEGRKMTVFYGVLHMLRVVLIYSSCIFFTIQPVFPKIIDVLLKNGSEPGEFSFPVVYFHLDEQKYYFYIVGHFFICTTVGLGVTIATDTMFIIFVQHGCGIFAALGHKLEQMGKKEASARKKTNTNHKLDEADVDFKQLAWCIERHNDAIEYAQLMDSTYTWCFFSIVGCNILLISITGLQIIKRPFNSQESIKFVATNVALMMHLYIENYMAQILTDHSITIRYCIENSEWYKLSQKAQKALYFMEMRCNAACKLTAGKITTMSVENFVAILKTSISCLTVLQTI